MTSQPSGRRNRWQHRQKVIVIIDDDGDLREMLCDVMADSSALIIQAETAEAGLAASNAYVIDIFVVDVFMPGKGGVWVIKQLRERHPNAVIISMSGGWKGMSPERSVKAAKISGAHFGFAKPFDIWGLHRLVGGILGDDEEILSGLDLASTLGRTAPAPSQEGVKLQRTESQKERVQNNLRR